MTTCPRCGEPIRDDDRACPACGMDLRPVRRFFRVAGGPSTPAGYLIAAVMLAALAVLFWAGSYGVAAVVCAVVAGLALVIGVIGRAVEIGQRSSRR